MQLFKTPNIKFLKYKYVALAVTGAIVLAGVLNITVFKGLKLGVDFGEGTLLRVMFKTPSTEGADPRSPPDRGPGQEPGAEIRQHRPGIPDPGP